MKNVWHYTIGLRLAEIIREGKIRPSFAYITPTEKPITWFSANPVWELTANKAVEDPDTKELTTLTMEETAALWATFEPNALYFSPLERARELCEQLEVKAIQQETIINDLNKVIAKRPSGWGAGGKAS